MVVSFCWGPFPFSNASPLHSYHNFDPHAHQILPLLTETPQLPTAPMVRSEQPAADNKVSPDPARARCQTSLPITPCRSPCSSYPGTVLLLACCHLGPLHQLFSVFGMLFPLIFPWLTPSCLSHSTRMSPAQGDLPEPPNQKYPSIARQHVITFWPFSWVLASFLLLSVTPTGT